MEQRQQEIKAKFPPDRAWEDRGFIDSWDERSDAALDNGW